MTYEQVQDRCKIQGRSNVLFWFRKHGQLNWPKGIELSRIIGAAVSNTASTKTPEQRIKELE